MIRLSMLLAAALLLSLHHAAAAEAKPLRVGDPAPALAPGSWAQGEAVTSFAPGTAYVVEFWATWCGPCRATIPHLDQLHRAFKDKGLVVIGQNVWERDQAQVAPFIAKMGDKMTYRVALDTADGTMAKTWMEASGSQGIPTAFLVDRAGVVVWIDHPAKLNEAMLSSLLAGTFDPKAAH
jgi:thiol-disulfide isomerase/thioredoxin